MESEKRYKKKVKKEEKECNLERPSRIATSAHINAAVCKYFHFMVISADP
jgi:hypothetical protein